MMAPGRLPRQIRRQLTLWSVLAGLNGGQILAANLDTHTDYDAPVRLNTLKVGGNAATSLSAVQKRAESGDADACFNLGTRYLDGRGVAADTEQAVAWLEKAAKSGQGKAAFRLGKMYSDGDQVPQDYARGLAFYTIAAQAGEMEAQHNIGAMLVSRRGVRRDFTEGLAWLLVAKQAGDGSDVSEQVRQQLAKRPKDVMAAEARAEEILKDLPRAKVLATLLDAPANSPVSMEATNPPAVVPLAAPRSVEKPALALPPVVAPDGFKITLPEKALVPVPETKLKEGAKP